MLPNMSEPAEQEGTEEEPQGFLARRRAARRRRLLREAGIREAAIASKIHNTETFGTTGGH
jgi:hypothetical protein